MAHACTPSANETEAAGSAFKHQPHNGVEVSLLRPCINERERERDTYSDLVDKAGEA